MRFQARAAALLFVTVASLSLGGCLVDKEKTSAKTYVSGTNILHTYVAGNAIVYDLKKITSTGTEYGTLEIKWETSVDKVAPFSNNQVTYPVLKEITNIYSSGSFTPEETAVRFIQQDTSGPTTGTVYVRAIDDLAAVPDYWLSAETTGLPGTLDKFEIFRSPIVLGSVNALETEFNVMLGCSGASSCQQSVGHFYNRLEAVNYPETVKGTGKGTFSNAYKITFQGDVAPTDLPLPFFDFLDICHASGSALTTHSGTLFIVPEIGVVQLINTCQTTGQSGIETVNYIATLRDTNIALPPLSN